ncbi:thioredoxin domain-containing protein [Xinfangfangia sp. D13-10-4-6]|uniref:thioredoxin domain-containing protein n=1 Tax=Pseudogemmobacter hezensis TaxID=2737662 RepID=UPI001557CAC4|nr:thioredoxin domain-containing protein [Pseudogemmobacter hezensis]NPD15963.1 thioredoxin domain-containing protein [Pseudogemmobacter hezensis]
MQRRDLILKGLGAGMGVGMVGGLLLAHPSVAQAEGAADDMIPGEAPRDITHDPDQPVLGNPDGDVTIVEYFDYQCPFCREGHPALLDLVRRDGNLRLVMKDFPIFGETSLRGVQLGLGSVSLGRYAQVNEALMAGKGRRVDAAGMDQAVRAAGVDPEAALAAFAREQDKWHGLISRNLAQADYFQLPGTPAYLVGLNLFPRVVTPDELTSAVAAIRRG